MSPSYLPNPEKGFIALLLTCMTAFSLFGQPVHEMQQIGPIATVSPDIGGAPFYKIPEIRSENGALLVDLSVEFRTFDFEGDSLRMRSYVEESKGVLGPMAPTLRLRPGEKFQINIHNNLPPEQGHLQKNYLFLLGQELAKELEVGKASEKLVRGMIGLARKAKGPKFLEDTACWHDSVLVGELDKSWALDWINEETESHHKFVISKDWNSKSENRGLKTFELLHHTGDHNVPHDFNTTNLHVHGLHVSPLQDDIFRKVPPTFPSQYSYDLDKTHTPGTFWYHPHVHGSTAIQVAGGMSGALILEDDTTTWQEKFPELLAASRAAHERIMIFNQVMYDPEIGELPDFYTLNRLRGQDFYPNGVKGTTINGRIKPIMDMQPGEVQRWRMVHSGFQTLLAMQFDPRFEVYQIAVDGIMFKKPRRIYSLHMGPGNRSDILIKAPEIAPEMVFPFYSVSYKHACEYFPEESICKLPIDTTNAPLLQVRVNGDKLNMELPGELPGPGPGHEDVDNYCDERKTDFSINDGRFMVNGKVFEAYRIDERPILNTQEQWIVSSSSARNHPYHIHVNPFQVWEFAGRKVVPPMWKDVVVVTTDSISYEGKLHSQMPGWAKVRTRYRKYTGDFVLHCHILHHEDQGMMQRVRIVEKPEESDLSPRAIETARKLFKLP